MKTRLKNIWDIPYIRSYLLAFVHAMLVVAYGRFGWHTNGTQAFTALVTIIATIEEHGQRVSGKLK